MSEGCQQHFSGYKHNAKNHTMEVKVVLMVKSLFGCLCFVGMYTSPDQYITSWRVGVRVKSECGCHLSGLGVPKKERKERCGRAYPGWSFGKLDNG